RGPLARIALLPLGRAEPGKVVVFRDLVAAIEVALVVVAVFPRTARVTLAGFLHGGRHSKPRRRARKLHGLVQYSWAIYQCSWYVNLFRAVRKSRQMPTWIHIFPGA